MYVAYVVACLAASPSIEDAQIFNCYTLEDQNGPYTSSKVCEAHLKSLLMEAEALIEASGVKGGSKGRCVAANAKGA